MYQTKNRNKAAKEKIEKSTGSPLRCPAETLLCKLAKGKDITSNTYEMLLIQMGDPLSKVKKTLD